MQKNIFYLFCVMLLFACGDKKSASGGSDGNGGGITVPVVWMTDETSTGNLGGIAGADTMCANTSDANHPNDGRTYKAMLVDGVDREACVSANCTTSEGTDWVLQPNTSYYQSDGTTLIFTTNNGGIFVYGTMDNNWSATDVGSNAWTGLANDWTTRTADPDNCNGWTLGTAGQGGAVGRNGLLTNAAIFIGGHSCGIATSVFCVSQ